MAKDKQTHTYSGSENAFVKKAFEAVAQIEAEAKQRKAQQLVALQEALSKIASRIEELEHQRQQVQDAIDKISEKPFASRTRGRPRKMELINVRDRVVRWLSSHPGESYTAVDLQDQFPELRGLPSLALLLKDPINNGAVVVDRSGGNRNTKYTSNRK